MHYSFEVPVSPDDDVDNPVVFPIHLGSGKLHEVVIQFEVGDGFSSAVTLWNRANQLLPSNADGVYSGDGSIIYAPIYYDLDVEDNELFVVAWNRGGLYDHSINVMLSVRGSDEPEILSLIETLKLTIDTLVSTIRSVF